MNGQSTAIRNPTNGEEKKFNFDYSYWSHDGFKEQPDGAIVPDTSQPNGKKFADQKKVYQDLGDGVLKNAWEGFNSTLFAYGQTGSGKSWSIVGYGINKGVVPLFCENIFKGIDEKKKSGDKTEFEVTFSMLEIYNEQVRDLLDPNGGNKRGGLRIRQHPKSGFYVEDLLVVPVQSYKDIELKMDEGTRNRTVAATNMNATSSRAHTIVGITFVQKFRNAAGEDTTKSALINLVDLAGSERAESTGATGDRLKEGAAINQSLSCLGNCIAALADKSSGKLSVKVPFRDSVLTKLLKNALGGNSKTIMIAAISPADINYEESLSTLRYADRAKQIKTSATVNEDPTDKLIRELQEENEKLKAMLGGNMKMEVMKDDDEDLSEEEIAKLKAEMEEEYKSRLSNNEKEMEEMKKSFEEKLKEAQLLSGDNVQTQINAKKKTTAHMYNLNTDPLLTGHIINFFDTPAEKIGNGKDEGETELILTGPGIAPKHAIVRMEGDKFTLEPGEPNVRLMHNGKAVVDKVELHHNDRVLFGTTQYFVFVHPKERDASKKTYPEVTFEMAQEEIAKHSGFDISSNKSQEEALLQEDVLDLMPAIDNANSISEDLDKKMKFELMIVSPEARGELTGRTEVMIRVINLETKHEWVWPREKFLNRKFVMQEMYQNYLDGETWDLPKEKDPFDEDYSADFHIGSVKVWMQSLAYMIESKVQLDITDFRGAKVGLLNVEVSPCDAKGKEYTEKDDVYVEDPKLLLDKPVHFLFKIVSARGLPTNFTDVYAKYVVYKEEKFTTTEIVKNTSNPDWNHKRVLSFPKAEDDLLNFLKESAVMVQIWGKQKPPKEKKSVNTKMAILADAKAKGGVAAANDNLKRFDAEKVKYMMEVSMLRKRQEKMEAKLRHIRQMLEAATAHKKKKISTDLISKIYTAGTEDQAQKCISLIPKEKDDDDSSSDSDSDNEDKPKTTSNGKEKKKEETSRKNSKSPSSESKKSSLCVVL
ncbi:kinesin protein KIF28P [Biomphalaria glabrata]|nr:kinesin-like protein KIF28P [Biomphalaria glabrata]KAI8767400.1 kinesin protein KIF28P [Biomphalaria glabrata]